MKKQESPNSKHQLNRLLGVTAWSRDHLADLLQVSTFTISRYTKGRRSPSDPEILKKITYLYDTIVAPLECEILRTSVLAEKHLLESRARSLPSPTSCPIS